MHSGPRRCVDAAGAAATEAVPDRPLRDAFDSRSGAPEVPETPESGARAEAPPRLGDPGDRLRRRRASRRTKYSYADREAARRAAAAEADSFEETEFSNAAASENEAARALREALESFSLESLESLESLDASMSIPAGTHRDALADRARRDSSTAPPPPTLAAAEAAAAARAARAAVSARESGALRSAPEHLPEPHSRSVDETHLAARAEALRRRNPRGVLRVGGVPVEARDPKLF